MDDRTCKCEMKSVSLYEIIEHVFIIKKKRKENKLYLKTMFLF